MNLYLICYDIEDDHERRQVANYLVARGERVQYSVFEVYIRDGNELARIQSEIAALCGEEANVRFYLLTQDGIRRSSMLNGDKLPTKPAVLII